MTPILFGASALATLFGILMCVTAVFLMLIVLVQRGRGGGLAGAFGGAGGQSAFGTKAGDLFTRITIGVATFWILLCIAALGLLGKERSRFGEDDEKEGTSVSAPAGAGAEDGAEDGATDGATDGDGASSGGSGGSGEADSSGADSSGGADATGDAPAGDTPPKDGG
jgi:preprotein translocase subunit SecG